MQVQKIFSNLIIFLSLLSHITILSFKQYFKKNYFNYKIKKNILSNIKLQQSEQTVRKKKEN
jgi:hypothetical protein